MKKIFYILLFFAGVVFSLGAQNSIPDFRWGNSWYFNLNEGESVHFKNQEIKLLNLHNHFNRLKIGDDTLWLKVSRRALPEMIGGMRVFVADNKNVKDLTSDSLRHGLLSKDALICLSDFQEPMLDFNKYIFPVSFSDGFIWGVEEDSHMFSFEAEKQRRETFGNLSHGGIDMDLHDARGKEMHWLVALENSTVRWVNSELNDAGKTSTVLLESGSQPGIFYLYEYLNSENVIVKEGQQLVRGEPLGTIWGDDTWGHLHFTVLKNDSVPAHPKRYNNLINGFPQLYELYFKQSSGYSKRFSKGRLYFGRPRHVNGNQKNLLAFEPYSGKGWHLEKWNPADKVEGVANETEGNARLKKVLFQGTPAECRNPENYYEYHINVRNGTYRIRAKVGDLFLPTWQKIEFEGVTAGTLKLDAGETEWTSERIVQVNDGTLSVHIYIDKEDRQIAGLGEIVFQQAY
ncbi:Peptidase family M23 [Tangfeifania diversioriginum]|uniref:Peptidase family M23 n=1 Tax=Tangfeifania diversioriginum TaxID=1168035 RepID=A0A1M6BZI8_9BACT|nr:M23 family metallopeptidase [Tangfeifania diversioriginum]SHI53894.1 Peptidase family M23 [Tangfeifania diversioriginum]